MPNGPAHRAVAAIALGSAHALSQEEDREMRTDPFLSLAGGFAFGTLPDLIEPATSPVHRKFFHSYAALALVGFAGWKLYGWKPSDPKEHIQRQLGLVILGAYGVHLLLDSQTSAGLPLV